MTVEPEVMKTFLICITVVLTTLAIVKHRRRAMEDTLRWVCRHCGAIHHYVPEKCAKCAKKNDNTKNDNTKNDNTKKKGSKWLTKDNPITEEW